jgi:tetratricopeptide (TPR) repeat protein
MKKILLLSAFFLINLTFAQKADLTSAILAFQKNDLTAAKKWIDVANTKILDGQTLKPKVTSKFHYYRGQIYLKHFQAAISDSLLELDFNFLDTASEAFTLDINLQSTFSKKSMIELNKCVYLYVDYAYKDYENQDYAIAGAKFTKAIYINKNPFIGKVDSVNMFNAALMSYSSGDYINAIKWSNELIQINPQDKRYHLQLIDTYNEMDDLENQLIAIKDARELLPTSKEIIFKEVNYYLTIGDNSLLKESLDNAIKSDSTNPILFFALGSTYAQLEDIDNAQQAYLSAIALDQNYFDAYNNLASLYLNQTIPLIEKKNNLDYNQEREFNRLSKKINTLYLKTIPYLEKGLIIQPTNSSIITALKEIYYKVDNINKMKSMKELMNLSDEEKSDFVMILFNIEIPNSDPARPE